MRALGRIPVKIGVSVAPAVRNVQADKSQKQTVFKYADGSRARGEGQPDYKWTLTCSLLTEKQQILEMIEAEKARGEVNISYQLGSEEYMLVDCGVDNEGASSDSDGTADLTIGGVAVDRLKIR